MNSVFKIILTVFLSLCGITFALEDREFLEVNELIDSWDVENAQSRLGNINQSSKVALYLLGKLMFYQGEYKESVKMLERAGVAEDDPVYVLAKNTFVKTAEFVTEEFEHFKIRYKKGKDKILISYLVDVLERIRKSAGEDLGYIPESKVLIEIYPDIESFTSVTPLSRDSISTTGTVAICQYNRIVISSPRLYIQGYSWLDTVSHEYIHYVLTKYSKNRLPLWWQEGIAKYMESRWRTEEGGGLTPWSRSILRNALVSGDIVTFEEMGNSFANLRSARRAALAFAQVETMVEFIVKKYGKEALRRIINDYSNSVDGIRNDESILGMNLEQFISEWKKFALTIVKDSPAQAEVLSPRIKDKSSEDELETALLSVKKSRDAVILGNILVERGRIDAAIVEYKKAVKFAPDSPFVVNKLAELYLKKKKIEEALKLLEKIALVYPDYYQTFINLSRVYRVQENDYALENALLKANAINPFDPYIHNELYLLYKKTGRQKEALREQQVLEILEKEQD